MKHKLRLRVSAAAFALLAALLFLLFFYHNNITKREYAVNSEDKNSSGAIYLEYDMTKSWNEDGKFRRGAEYDFVIKNNTHNDIYGWFVTLHMDKNYEIDSSWNGEFVMDGSYILVKPADYNERVEKEDEQTFGFVAHTAGEAHIDSYEIIYHRESNIFANPLFWLIIASMLVIIVINIVDFYFTHKLDVLQRRHDENRKVLEQSFNTFAKIIDAKDSYTKGRSMRVAIYARLIAEEMGMSKEEQDRIYLIGMMHDIGKIGVTDVILNKPGQLTNYERDVIQTHVDVGGEILKDFTSIPDIADGAQYHHERWDGTGYSKHLKGEEIPLIARIICVADSFDAMSSVRCYRKSLSMEQIKYEFKTCSGRQFDPEIVPYMIKLINEEKVPVAVDI